MGEKSKLEFFPKDENRRIRLDEAYALLLFFGTFGSHQFYIGKRRRALYLLSTCGFSHLMLLLSGGLHEGFFLNLFGIKWSIIIVLSGYVLGMPVWVWDFCTLYWQVKKVKGQLLAL